MSIEDTGDFKPKLEDKKLPESVTKIERRIIDSLTKEDKDIIRKLFSSNLGNSKKEIVGVRTKDIFSLFEQIHPGHLRVGLSEIMFKDADESSSIFFTINPDSEYLKKKRPDILNNVQRFSDFESMIEFSKNEFGDIGIKQAVHRNILSLIPDQKEMFSELIEIYKKNGIVEEDLTFEEAQKDAREIFFDAISNRIQEGIEEIRPNSRRQDPELAILGRYLMKSGIPLEEARKMLLSFADRSCVQIGFNEKLFQHKVTADRSSVHDSNEFIAYVSSNQLEQEVIFGFEPKGSFEKQVLEAILK